ncbi:MAG: FAD-dependent oxidoreductase [Patescibacteria group bacterium]
MDHSESDQRLNKRIAIIGAGAAGLSAAHALKAKGYSNITVFERSNRVGGKCCTVEIEGKNYELGAGVLAEDNSIVLRLAEEFNIPLAPIQFDNDVTVDGLSGIAEPKRNIFESAKLLKELAKYCWLTQKYRATGKSGLANTPHALAAPFTEFAKKHKIENLAREFALFFTGFGYDYFERIPAAYVLKYYRWSTLLAFMQRKVYRLPNGIQHLWTAVAAAHTVRLNTAISHIERSETSVSVTTERGTEEFDTLIIASPLDETLSYIDSTDDERNLFSKIQYVDYVTIACTIEGILDGDGYVPSNFTPHRAGHPVFWHHRHADARVYTFYALADGSQTDTDLTDHMTDLVKKMGGVVSTIHSITHWKYFPHISSEIMKDGFFDRIESIQGTKNTFYVGESLNFSTVGLASEHANDLVNRLF